MKIIKRLSEHKFLLLAILWTVAITVASLVSMSSLPRVKIVGNDKIIHFVFYFVFVILWGLANKKSYFKIKNDWSIVLFAIVYGIIIEVLQGVLTKTRQADIYDALANSSGAVVGFVSLYCMKNKIFNKFF
ncbi:VanZ family protein [Flavobacterium channae]|uniref:VanZ family protein n=1 Tax=Flavobacterium channae TaxID=2897181 RepID=UPI001E5DA6D2|nr:VanZ family protein [Flavobacterium channae]UGS23323.1 VanZ family protein [Flavobacterium channae]